MRVALVAVAIVACKAYDYNPRFDVVQGSHAGRSDVDAPDGFVPAVACSVAGEARLTVDDRFFAIVCGCLEPPWAEAEGSKVCTIPVGTTVVWTFVGSEDHTVTESAGAPDSGIRNAGATVRQTYSEVGDYVYECTEHSSMAGYIIRVIAPE
jgi:hypothetical protein